MMSKPSAKWILIAVFLFCTFLLLQLPAAWIVTKLSPNNQQLSAISGNLIKGSAIWQSQTAQGMLQANISWTALPWRFFLLKLSSHVVISSGNTQLTGLVSMGKNNIDVSDLNGQIAPETLEEISNIQLPAAPLVLKDIALSVNKTKGVVGAGGQLNWAGGTVGYPFEGRVEKANLPLLSSKLAVDKNQLHLEVTTGAQEKMADVWLSPDKVVDVKLTQRLLQHVAGYNGQAGLDTVVVSVKQPLSSFGGAF